MADESEEKPKRPVGATILIVIGILWTALTGLCTAGFFIGVAIQGAAEIDVGALVATFYSALIIWTVCAIPGFLIWMLGRWWAKRRRA